MSPGDRFTIIMAGLGAGVALICWFAKRLVSSLDDGQKYIITCLDKYGDRVGVLEVKVAVVETIVGISRKGENSGGKPLS